MGLSSPEIRNVFRISGFLSVYDFFKPIQVKDMFFLEIYSMIFEI